MKIVFFLFFAIAGFSQQITLENQTSSPSEGEKMAVQWAYSAKGVDEGNHALQYGETLKDVQPIKQSGTVRLTIPKQAEYFRVLKWSKGSSDPDFHTNWVEAVDQKAYRLDQDHLVPAALMSGTGC